MPAHKKNKYVKQPLVPSKPPYVTSSAADALTSREALKVSGRELKAGKRTMEMFREELRLIQDRADITAKLKKNPLNLHGLVLPLQLKLVEIEHRIVQLRSMRSKK